jgi:hypothetical protein
VRGTRSAKAAGKKFGPAFEETFRQRLSDADEFYDRITPSTLTAATAVLPGTPSGPVP